MSLLSHAIYRHYKGRYYRALFIVEDSEVEGEYVVVYQQLYRSSANRPVGHMWMRPVRTFYGKVEEGRARSRYRFERTVQVPRKIARLIQVLDHDRVSSSGTSRE